MKKKFGFTLAEVLITLGIIGVVAAMTIPTLIANTNSARFRSQFKKSISTLSQAGLMAQAQYDIDYSTPTGGCEDINKDDPDTIYTICAIFNGTLTGHVLSSTPPVNKNNVSYEPTLTTTNVPSNVLYLTLSDGSLVVFDSDMSGCHRKIDGTLEGSNCYGYIDVNGTTLPNREISCTGSTSEPTGMLGLPAYAEEQTLDLSTCVVPNDANHMTDIFPVVFHDATVEPSTPAGRYVLTTSK